MASVIHCTKEEEETCFIKYQQSGKLQDLERLFLSLAGIFAQRLAKLAKTFKLEYEDVQQQFMLEVINGIGSFKPEKGFRFSAYAEKILRSMWSRTKQNHQTMSRKINEITFSETSFYKYGDENTDSIWDVVEDRSSCDPYETAVYEEHIERLDEFLSSSRLRNKNFRKYIVEEEKGAKDLARFKRYRMRKQLKEVFLPC